MARKVLGVAVLIAAAAVLLLVVRGAPQQPAEPARGTTTATTTTNATSSPTTNTVSIGGITFSIPRDFALATSTEQVPVKSYIPPCDPGFDDCVYYSGTAYKDTNFESAGVRVQLQDMVGTKDDCIAALPEGYSNIKPAIYNGDTYSTSVFPVGDAGAGHYASGEVYRLWTDDSCFEFETRIGATQFANYPTGFITEFGSDGRHYFETTLRGIVDSVTLGDEHIMFPNLNN